MYSISYANAAAFLADTQEELEAREALNSLMLGICLRLAEFPEQIKTTPTFKAVRDDDGLVLAAVMTPPYNIVLSGQRDDIGEAARDLAETLAAEKVALPGALGPSGDAESFVRAWSDVTGASAEVSMRQRVFALRKVMLPRAATGNLRPAAGDDLELAIEWCFSFMVDAFGEGDIKRAREIIELRVGEGAVYLWEDDRPVSMAMKTRPTRRGISVSFVYTPPELRRRGYATACVAELSRLLLESGREFCSLFTDRANPTSNHIYQVIGYRPVADFDQYTFA